MNMQKEAIPKAAIIGVIVAALGFFVDLYEIEKMRKLQEGNM